MEKKVMRNDHQERYFYNTRLCKVDFIGVKYGYGSIEAMERQGAAVFADTPAGLISLLS